MADNEAPRYPLIHVVHPDSDVSPGEMGITRIHNQHTGQTYFSDTENYLQAIKDNPNK